MSFQHKSMLFFNIFMIRKYTDYNPIVIYRLQSNSNQLQFTRWRRPPCPPETSCRKPPRILREVRENGWGWRPSFRWRESKGTRRRGSWTRRRRRSWSRSRWSWRFKGRRNLSCWINWCRRLIKGKLRRVHPKVVLNLNIYHWLEK